MEDQDKTKEQLINELTELRQRRTELEKSEDERKRAEVALKKSEKRFYTFVENLIEGFTILSPILDSDGRIIDFRFEYINEAGCRMNHKAREEHTGKTLLDLFPKQKETGLFDDCVKVVNSGQPVSKEYVLYEALYGGGKRLKQALNYQVTRFEDGLLGTWQDTTEKKRGEESLKHSEERLKRLVENSKDAIMMTDLEGTILYYSGPPEFGVSPEDLLRKNFFGIFEPVVAAKLMNQLKQVIREKEALTTENLIPWKEESFWFSIHMYPAKDEKGRTVAVGIIARNITERKRAENLLRIERDLGLAVSAATGLDETLRLCFEAAIRVSGLDCGGIYLVDEVSGDLDLVFHKGLNPEFVESVRHYDADSMNARLVMEGKPVYPRHQELRVHLDEAQFRESLRAIAVIPVPHEGRVVGCLDIISHAHDEVPDYARIGLETIATQIGNAIARSRTAGALRESEAKYRELAESISDVFFAMDRDLRCTYWNKASEQLTGIPAKDAIGTFLYELFPDTTETRRAERICLEVLKTEQPQSFVNEYQHGGKNTFFESSVYPSMSGLSVFVKDITERKKLEEILEKEQQELKLIIDSSPIIVFYKDKEGKFIRVNKAFSEALKMQEEEFVGKTVFDLYSAKIAQGMTDGDQEVLKSGSPMLNIIEQYESASGIRWVQTDKIPICDKNGIPVGLIGFAQDITERKQAEDALHESEERYRNLVESISDVVYAIDGSSVLTYISPVVKNTLGYEPDELIGRQFLEFVHKEDRDLLMRRFSEPREGSVKDSDYRVIGKEGEIKWVRTLTNPIIEEGGFAGARGVLIDVTERKQAEEQLRSSTQELRALAERLQSAREEERTQVAREIHDELGQALTALKMDLSWLSKKLPKDQDPLHEKARSMSQLLDATVRTVKRISTELRPGLLDDLGLAAAIEWQAEEFQNRTGIKCTVAINPEGVVLEAKLSTAIFRIFQETLTNVARHANATKVEVNLKKKAHQIELKVQDKGKGITQKQISSSKSFGLIGMRERIFPWQGELKIIGTPGKGTTVTVTIPLKKS